MKVLIVSDVHADFHKNLDNFVNKLSDADILLVAGDLIEMKDLHYERIVRSLCGKFSYVIHVPGNHEYYGTDMEWVEKMGSAMEALYPNYHFCNRRVVEIGGIRIAGATTWFPWRDTIDKNYIWMNDFSQIKDFKKYGGGDIRKPCIENDISVRWWRTVEAEIWVMHHAPSFLSISPQYAGDDMNCFYVSPQMEDLLREKQPHFCIHGHMHNSFDYMVEKTNVLCNPYGYEGSNSKYLNPRFRPDMIIDTDGWTVNKK